MDATSILAEALRIRTDIPDGLQRWQDFLEARFPETSSALERHVLDEYALYYRWMPESPHRDSPQAQPILLLAHYDVVPVEEDAWSVSPWSGEERQGYLYGRGALDDKLSHVAIMIAVESLLAEGHRPTRPVYLAFGGDEEIGGARGAARLAERFSAEGTRFACTLDEGAAVVRGMLPGLPGPSGLIGCAEKGLLNVAVVVHAAQGHAATPPRPDARHVIATVLRRLRSFPIDVPTATAAFIRALGRELSGPVGALLRAYPATAPLVHRVLAAQPATDAMLRTTSALTMLRGSSAPNVLPRDTVLTFNIRLVPGDSIEGVLERMRRALRGLPVEVKTIPEAGLNAAPPESPISGRYYDAIARAIRSAWGAIPVLPYLVTSTTDSRHYTSVSDVIYRFAPMEIGPEDLDGIHGVDERVAVSSIDKAVRFYRAFLIDAAESEIGTTHPERGIS